jgi:hypothetical protein
MEENQNNRKEEYIKEVNRRTWDDLRTTHQRFDYLLVTVDGAGIYLSLELMKFLYDHSKPIEISLKVFGMCLTVSIIFNLISQFCSFNVCQNILMIEQRKILYEDSEINYYNKKAQNYKFFASLCMWVSLILMFVGVIGLIFFLYRNF